MVVNEDLVSCPGSVCARQCRRGCDRRGRRLVILLQCDLLNTLSSRDLDAPATRLSADTGLPHLKTAAGEHIAGVYRQRLNLTSGRIAMIDNGLGFQFVPWSPPPRPERRLGGNGCVETGRTGWTPIHK